MRDRAVFSQRAVGVQHVDEVLWCFEASHDDTRVFVEGRDEAIESVPHSLQLAQKRCPKPRRSSAEDSITFKGRSTPTIGSERTHLFW